MLMARKMVLGCLLGVTAILPAAAQYGQGQGQGGGDWRYNRGDAGRWDPSWEARPNPGRGACFYADAGFRGHHFCVRAGDRIPQLPGNIGDRISSIQTFGGARARVFNDINFQGVNTMFQGTVPDLSRIPTQRGGNWNDRISSVVVR